MEWSWLKRYRAWRANRKTFRSPENWVEPEPRDDKTPSFPPTPLPERDADQDVRQPGSTGLDSSTLRD